MKNKKLAILLMLISALSFSFMGVMVKNLSHLPFVEAVFFRNVVSVIIAASMILYKKIPIVQSKKNLKLLIARSVIGLMGVTAYFYSIQNMPLADSAILNKMSPFFVLIFAFILLKERINKYQILTVILAFIGIAFVIKPELDSNILPSLVGLGAAITAGLAYTIIRMLSGKEHPTTIVFFFSAISVLVMLPLLIIYYVQPSTTDFIYLILTGVFAAIGQYCLTYSYKFAKASEVSIYSYATVIFSAILAYILWHENLSFSSIVGILVVLTASYLNYKVITKAVLRQ